MLQNHKTKNQLVFLTMSTSFVTLFWIEFFTNFFTNKNKSFNSENAGLIVSKLVKILNIQSKQTPKFLFLEKGLDQNWVSFMSIKQLRQDAKPVVKTKFQLCPCFKIKDSVIPMCKLQRPIFTQYMFGKLSIVMKYHNYFVITRPCKLF